MANTANRGIAKSWSLLAWVKEYGQPRYVDDFAGENGETFAALSFSADRFEPAQVRNFVDKNGETRKSSYVMVSFSQNLSADETTMEAIAANADKLQVVELQQDAEHPYASYKLCSKGEYTERGTLMSIH
jgi:hypothetical protein